MNMLALADYERVRGDVRRSAMAVRALRRVALGPHASLAFESTETVRYQIHEMLRAEGITRPEAVRDEIEAYRELLPARGELSATLLLELDDEQARPRWLARLSGIERHLRLVVGDVEVDAIFDARQLGDERPSSVQFVRFPLPPAARAALAERRDIRVRLDHPDYGHTAVLSPATVEALARDQEEVGR